MGPYCPGVCRIRREFKKHGFLGGMPVGSPTSTGDFPLCPFYQNFQLTLQISSLTRLAPVYAVQVYRTGPLWRQVLQYTCIETGVQFTSTAVQLGELWSIVERDG